ncbi:HAD family hydrolase [Nocardia abscessus]|uniref:HAD family hydrolase n=1 Tax=Nocardia abscessus TaxID=120957 RepID=UPI002456698D|nr:HAD family phosphatase [Nocardia abscessus]
MTTSPTRYRALIADFGGVVTTSFHGALRGFCVREGLAPDALERVFSLDGGAKGLLTDLERGAVTQQQFVDHLAPLLGVDPSHLLERILTDLDLEHVVTDAIQQLRRNGIRVAVLSNSWGAGPYDPYQPYDLANRFDVVVLSHEVGLRKPEPAIFELTADRLGVDPLHCVFVDDVAHYLDPARHMGMGTIHAVDPETTVKELARLFDIGLDMPPRSLAGE